MGLLAAGEALPDSVARGEVMELRTPDTLKKSGASIPWYTMGEGTAIVLSPSVQLGLVEGGT